MARATLLEEGLPKEALLELQKNLGLPQTTLARLLRTTPRTLQRQGARLSPELSDRLYRLYRLYERALLFHGDPERARRFLLTPNPALGGKRPLDLAVNEAGLEATLDLLDNLEEGVYL
ncbi:MULTISPECIES: antitoxin Xre-like helix-turn-helix domain-containing protein [Thermus]|uniref:antitoxin Xre-like helix-turn-helix domain-containing protein n=1 Tax=Thermus TaxID=270 RepID=UPI001F43256D|nr:antitoxin Xre/MbcA/ParS toxin-binding domain-containing protein [Thermus brockianus]